MHVGAAEYPHPPGVAFELVGVDFLVDSALRPWLLEFNAVPSMARQVTAQRGTPGRLLVTGHSWLRQTLPWWANPQSMVLELVLGVAASKSALRSRRE